MRRLICVFGCLIVSRFGEAKCVKSALEFCTINSDAEGIQKYENAEVYFTSDDDGRLRLPMRIVARQKGIVTFDRLYGSPEGHHDEKMKLGDLDSIVDVVDNRWYHFSPFC